MSPPSSAAPDEEMRSPPPKPHTFAGFLRPIILLLLCALCSVSIGVFAYVRSSLYIHSSSPQTYSFPNLQAPGVRALPVTELEKQYDLSILATLPAAGPGRAARILLSAWSDHERVLYSIDTDGRNLQRLPERLPCQEDDGFLGVTLTPDMRMLACDGPLRLYPFDSVTLRVTGQMTVSEPRVGIPVWGSDSHQFVTWTTVQGNQTVALYRLDDAYTTSTLAALLAMPSLFLISGTIQWSPDGRYLLMSATDTPEGGESEASFYLLPFSTVEARLATPSGNTWLPGVPVAQIHTDDHIPLHTSAYNAYDAVWEPGSSALTVPYGNTYITSQRAFGRLTVPDGRLTPLLQFPGWPSPDPAVICQNKWAPDGVLVFDLCRLPCTDCQRPPITPGNDLYVYTPPNSGSPTNAL
jgi:hypothetical protein